MVSSVSSQPHQSRRLTKYQWLSVLALLVMFNALTRGFFLIEPPGVDQTLFLSQAVELLNGKHMYSEIWEHKPPGVIVVYTAAMALFGRSYLAVQTANALAGCWTSIALCWFCWKLSRRLTVGVVASLVYLTFYSGIVFGGFWATAQAEIWIDPLVLLAMILLSPATERFKMSWRAPVAGICTGLVILLKYSALPLVIGAAALILSSRLEFSKKLRSMIFYCAGVAVPGALLFGYLLATDGVVAFWQATFSFNLEHLKVSSVSRWIYTRKRVFFSGSGLGPLYLLSMCGPIALGWLGHRRRTSEPPSDRPSSHCWLPRLFRLGFGLWILSLVQIYWQAKFWSYHYHIVLLPLSMLTAVGVVAILDTVRAKLSTIGRVIVIGALLMVIGVPQVRLLMLYEGQHHVSRRWLGQVPTSDFLATYKWGATNYDYRETMEVAARVRASTRPTDSIFVWGYEPGVYFFSQREGASRFLYDYPLSHTSWALHNDYVDQLLADLDQERPELFLVLLRDSNMLENDTSWDQLQSLVRLRVFVEEHYEQLWTEGDFICFRAN
jgi:hypothetical protein